MLPHMIVSKEAPSCGK
jgi:hypothetical protein